MRIARLALASLAAAALAWPARAAAAPALPLPVERGPATARAVAFGVNVVWGTEYVLPIAAAFRAVGGRATFFLGGRWAQAHRAEALALRRAGMEIASHGDAHRHVGRLSLAANLAEIDRAQRAIEDATGVRPRLYAPAYGEVGEAVRRAAALRGLRLVLWSIDTVDWRDWHTPDIIRRRVLERLAPGAIVLVHPTDRTLAALPGLLDAIRRRGYRLVTVSDLLAGVTDGAASDGLRPGASVPPRRNPAARREA